LNQLGDGGKRLGELLVERGWVTGEQVLRAILSQRSQGGRLGTCLLELDLVSEERLVEILAHQQGAPAAPLESLRFIPDEVVGLIPPRVAERCRAVPIAATDREVAVALLDARNMALLDELAFCTSRRVRACVANEARIYDALARHYGVDCPRRFRDLVDRLNRSRYLWKDEAATAATDPDEVRWREPEEALGGPLPAATAAPFAPPPPGTAAAPVSPETSAEVRPASLLRLEDVDLLLRHTGEARAVGEILLRFVRQSFERCALFHVRDGALTGWLAEGQGLDRDLFRALRVNLREPSVFLNLARGAELHLGPLAPMPVHRQLARCWGAPWPGECLILPIRIGRRLVTVLYADRGAEKLGALELTTWTRLATIAGMALELCILKKKKEETN
jgi:hypothetical protein